MKRPPKKEEGGDGLPKFTCTVTNKAGLPFDEVWHKTKKQWYAVVPEKKNEDEVPYKVKVGVKVSLPVTDENMHWCVGLYIDGTLLNYQKNLDVCQETGICTATFHGYKGSEDYSKFFEFTFSKKSNLWSEGGTRGENEEFFGMGTITARFHQSKKVSKCPHLALCYFDNTITRLPY
jgi:hypothetical protein